MGCAEEELWGKLGVIVPPLGWSSSTAQVSEESLRVQPVQEDGLVMGHICEYLAGNFRVRN